MTKKRKTSKNRTIYNRTMAVSEEDHTTNIADETYLAGYRAGTDAQRAAGFDDARAKRYAALTALMQQAGQAIAAVAQVLDNAPRD